MSASEREKQLLRREGYTACFNDIAKDFSDTSPHGSVLKIGGGIEKRAAEKYPLPTIQVPRIEAATDRDGSRVEFSMQFEGIARHRTLAWRRPSDGPGWGFDTFTRFQFAAADHPELLRLWADLLEKPFREEEEPELVAEDVRHQVIAETMASDEATTSFGQARKIPEGYTTGPRPGSLHNAVPATHCESCDRPELCDIIKRGTAPCGKNAGIGPAAVKVVEELRRRREHSPL